MIGDPTQNPKDGFSVSFTKNWEISSGAPDSANYVTALIYGLYVCRGDLSKIMLLLI